MLRWTRKKNGNSPLREICLVLVATPIFDPTPAVIFSQFYRDNPARSTIIWPHQKCFVSAHFSANAETAKTLKSLWAGFGKLC